MISYAPRWDRSSVGFTLAATLLCVCTGALVAKVDGLHLKTSYGVSLAFIVACLVPFVLARRRGFDLFEPVYLVATWYLLAFPLRRIFIQAFPERTAFLGRYPYSDLLDRATYVSLAGFIALLVGYYIPAGVVASRAVPRPSFSFASHPLNARIAAILGVGVAAWSYLLFVVHRVHGLDDSFNYSIAESFVVQCGYFLSYAVSLSAIVIFGRAQRIRGRELWILAIVTAPSFVVAAIFARRFLIILALLSLVIAYHYGRRRIGLLPVVAVAVVLLGVVFPVIQADRAAGVAHLRGSGPTAAVSRIESGVTAVYGGGSASMRTYIVDGLMNRMSGIDTLAGVMKATPSRLPYRSGLEYVTTPVSAVIPRALWTSKPKDRFAQEFAPEYFGSSNYQTHVVTYNQPDLFMHFGFWGVLVGCFAFGVLYRGLHAYLIGARTRPEPGAIFVYTFFLMYLAAVEWSVAEIEIAVAKGLPFIALVVWWLRTPGASTST